MVPPPPPPPPLTDQSNFGDGVVSLWGVEISRKDAANGEIALDSGVGGWGRLL